MIKAVIFDMFETLITHYKGPLYFGAQMAQDAGISQERFQKLWRPTENDRSIGNITFEEVLEMILKKNHCYSPERMTSIVAKRVATKQNCFEHLHPQIIEMLNCLRDHGVLIGLISNCFSEEADVIRKSVLFPYFDAVLLSYEQGVQKPDIEIFTRCMNQLSVTAKECIYVGDGGSLELETAEKLGMNAMQAVWYLQEKTMQPSRRKEDFLQLETPLDVMKYI